MVTLAQQTDKPQAVPPQGLLAISVVPAAISPYSSRCDISYSRSVY